MNEVNCVSWYLDLIPKVVKEKIGDVTSFFVMLPSYFSSFPTLTRYSRFHPQFRGKVRKELLELEDFIPRLKGPEDIKKATKFDVLVSKVTEETHPGLITRYIARSSNSDLKKRRSYTHFNIQKKDVLHAVINSVCNS